MRASVFVLFAVATTACQAPPEAPAELAELAGFMFERLDQDNTAEVSLGLENLEAWLQANLNATGDGSVREGYTVREFDPSLLEEVRPELTPVVTGAIAGSSVATESAFDVVTVARALTVEEQEIVFPESYVTHERDFPKGEDCFMSQGCDFLDTDNVVETNYFGLLTVDTHSRSQYRWVTYGENDDKIALLNRTWLVEPAETGGAFGDLVSIEEQMYFGVILPWEGGSVRLGTIWVAIELLGDLNEGWALSQMVEAMKNDGDTLETYLQGAQ